MPRGQWHFLRDINFGSILISQCKNEGDIMFETLFTSQQVLARHRASPCPESRARFLVHCSEQGYPHATLQKIAWVLQVFSQSIDLCKPGRITHKEVEFAVDHRVRFHRSGRDEASRSSRRLFIHIATAWLRFLGYLEERSEEHTSELQSLRH